MPLTETLPPRRKAAETAATAGTCVYCQVPLPDEARAIVRCGCGCGWVVFECRPAWKVGRGSPPPSRNWVAGPQTRFDRGGSLLVVQAEVGRRVGPRH